MQGEFSDAYIDLVLNGALAASMPRLMHMLHVLAATCRALCALVRAHASLYVVYSTFW